MTPRLHVLNPGDVAVATRGDRLETLLGSCVAVLLSDPRGTVGAMCHIVHASDPSPNAPAGPLDTHHARPALQAMTQQLQRLGIVARLCQARIYGGGNMFPQRYAGSGHVGDTNVQRVLALLAEAGIPVLARSVGGTGYRRLSWDIGLAEPHCEVVEATPSAP